MGWRWGTGWSLDAQDTLGELQLRVWLREGGIRGDLARLAVEGWGGDRVGLLGGPDADTVVLATTWDTDDDAVEFRTAADDAALGLGLDVLSKRSGRNVAILIGGGDRKSTRLNSSH